VPWVFLRCLDETSQEIRGVILIVVYGDDGGVWILPPQREKLVETFSISIGPEHRQATPALPAKAPGNLVVREFFGCEDKHYRDSTGVLAKKRLYGFPAGANPGRVRGHPHHKTLRSRGYRTTSPVGKRKRERHTSFSHPVPQGVNSLREEPPNRQ
jgi:hypothetical protein